MLNLQTIELKINVKERKWLVLCNQLKQKSDAD